MTSVYFFHQLDSGRLRYAQMLIQRAWRTKKHWLMVYAPDNEVAVTLNRLLWTEPPTGFYPHCFDTMPIAPATPILISRELQRPEFATTHPHLVNLSNAEPPAYQRFASLIEVISNDTDVAAAARARVKRYREAGCTVQFLPPLAKKE